MTSQSFRDSLNSLGWSRREAEVPVNTSQRTGLLSSLQSLNPFGDGGGYVSLPTTEGAGAPLPAPTRREEEEGWFACKCYSISRLMEVSPLQLRCTLHFVCIISRRIARLLFTITGWPVHARRVCLDLAFDTRACMLMRSLSPPPHCLFLSL